MSINDANFKPLSDGVILYPGQRVIKIGNRMFPVGIGNNAMPAAFDLVKVTGYIPYSPEITEITSIEVSGMGIFGEDDPDYAEDYTAANGKYVVTSETSGKSGRERVYKHETEDYWLKSYKDEYDEYGGDGWVFVTDVNEDYGFVQNIPYELESGTSDSWHNGDWGAGFTLTLTCTTTTTSEQPLVLKGVKATGYTDDGWIFSSSETSFSGFEYTPKKAWIYAATNNKLIGQPIAYDADVPAGTVFLFNKTLTDVINRTTVINYGLTASDTGIVCTADKYAEIPANSLPSDVMCDDKPWTFEIKFRCLDAAAWTEESLCPFGRGYSPRFDVLIRKTNALVGGMNELEIPADLADGNWHIYKITHGSNNLFTAYLDDKMSVSLACSRNLRASELWIGWDGERRYAEPLEIEYIRIGNTVEV